MIIKNGSVFQEDKSFAKKDLYIENGMIVNGPDEVTDKTEVDAEGLLVLPGLIDVHSHGAMGHDFSDGDMEGLKEILAYEFAHGITTYCPTSMTIEREKLEKIFRETANLPKGTLPDGRRMSQKITSMELLPDVKEALGP